MITQYRNTKVLGLGDSWNLVNHLLQISKKVGKPTEIKLQKEEDENLFLLIQSLLDHGTQGFRITKEPFETELNLTQEPYFRTKTSWEGGSKPIIVTKVSSKSKLLGSLQDLPESEVNTLDTLIKSNKYERIEIEDQTLLEIVKLMSIATAYIGINTGMSHVAHSVGLPTVLIHRNRDIPLQPFHGKNKYLSFPCVKEFIDYVNHVNPKA